MTGHTGVVIAAVGWVLLAAAGCGSPTVDPPPVPGSLYGDVRASLDEAREAVLRRPQAPEAWGTLAMLCDAHDLTSEAAICYRQAITLDESDPRWPYLLANLLAADDPAAAEALFRTSMKACSAPEPGLRLAALLRDRGAADEAVDVLRVEASADPDIARIHYELARCLDQTDRLQEAVEEIGIAARLAGQHRSVRELAAELLYRAGRFDEAHREAAIAQRLPRETAGWPDPWREEVRRLRRDPHWQASSIAMAATAGRMEAGAALSALATLASEHPDDWTIGGEFAQLLLVAGQLEAAIGAATTAIELHPQAVRLWIIRGTAELLSENWSAAEADLGRAVELKPDDAAAWSDLAFVQEQLGRDAAIDSLETAIALAPLDTDKRIRLIELLIDRGLLADATRAIDAMALIAEDHPAVAELRKTVAATDSTPDTPPQKSQSE